MSCSYTQIVRLLSDTYLFPALQMKLVIFSLLMSFIGAMRAGKGGVPAQTNPSSGTCHLKPNIRELV